MIESLHNLTVPSAEGDNWSLRDYSGAFKPDQVQVYFRNLEQALCGHIGRSQLVVGAVAWLTSEPILKALAKVPGGVGILVQKEDFLRPETGWFLRSQSKLSFPGFLRDLYQELASPPDRYACWPEPLHMMSCCTDPGISPVRCVGNHNREKSPAFPRMHNKFLVFCDMIYPPTKRRVPSPADKFALPGHEPPKEIDDGHLQIHPRAVWTGSFNMTKNATASFENAIYIPDSAVAAAYLNEWAQLMALSEPLDWTAEWCEPEWRIGT